MIIFGMFLGLCWGLYLLLQFTPKGVHSFDLPQWVLVALALFVVWVCVAAMARRFRR